MNAHNLQCESFIILTVRLRFLSVEWSFDYAKLRVGVDLSTLLKARVGSRLLEKRESNQSRNRLPLAISASQEESRSQSRLIQLSSCKKQDLECNVRVDS
jgi:hypothetical protein